MTTKTFSIRGQGSRQHQLEKLKNEAISRRDDEAVSSAIQREGATKKSAIFELPLKGGRIQASFCVARRRRSAQATPSSSRLESCQNSLRSIDAGANFALFVEAGEAGTRLDKFLAKRVPAHSRAYFQKLIEKGKVTVNGQSAEKDASLKAGDLVFGEFEPISEISIAPDSSVKFKVIYDAKEFAVVEKPAGLVTHPSATHKSGTLVNGLLARWPEIAGAGESVLRPGIVHRLDKETSGLMVVAKTQPMYLWLKKQFQDRKVEKKYIALVFGKMSQKEGEISVPIARHKTKQITVPDANKGFLGNAYKSRKASTGFKILGFYPVRSRARPVRDRESSQRIPISNGTSPKDRDAATSNGVYDSFTLVEAIPKTGRMHQIRVHFKHIGHPLAGDRTYASKRVLSALPMERHFLHAGYLAFSLPSGEIVEFSSDLPADLKKVLAGLARAKFLDKD